MIGHDLESPSRFDSTRFTTAPFLIINDVIARVATISHHNRHDGARFAKRHKAVTLQLRPKIINIIAKFEATVLTFIAFNNSNCLQYHSGLNGVIAFVNVCGPQQARTAMRKPSNWVATKPPIDAKVLEKVSSRTSTFPTIS
ncbi:hypothetical protein AJ87_37550 [Rhizobium yanglingense]|nr:hypothetical protein AJ87_37550 [Rhizobium yanglingense]